MTILDSCRKTSYALFGMPTLSWMPGAVAPPAPLLCPPLDSVDRYTIWGLLRAHGMPMEIIDLMRLLYSDTLSAVRMDGATSEWFRVDRGVRHEGCWMAPGLFLLPMNKILDDTVSQGSLGINIGTERFTDLGYAADDVTLLAESCGDVVDSLETMSQEALRFGLEINWTKTKIQPIGVQGTIPDHVLVAGNQVELVPSYVRGFCYLGSHVKADSGRGQRSGGSLRRRVAIARDCMSSLQRGIWKTGIRIDTKLRLFKA